MRIRTPLQRRIVRRVRLARNGRAIKAAGFFLWATLAAAQPHASFEIRGLSQVVPGALGKVSNLPANIRTVPGHQGDPDAGVPQLIPDSPVSAGAFTSALAGVGPQLRIRRFSVQAGALFGVLGFPWPHTASSGNTREVNQFGTTQRGVGTRLWYYAVAPHPRLFSGFYTEGETSVSQHCGVLGGYSRTLYDLQINSGWDRYDALEHYASYTIAQNTLQSFYAGLRIGPPRSSVLVLGGGDLQGSRVQPIAGDATIKLPAAGGFVSVGVSSRFGWW